MVVAKVFNPVVTSHTGHRLEKRRSLGGVVVIEKSWVGLMYGGKNRRFCPSLTGERSDCCQYCVFQTQRHFDQSDRRGGKRWRKNLKSPKDGSTLPNTSYQGEVELVNTGPEGSIINSNHSITIIIITNTTITTNIIITAITSIMLTSTISRHSDLDTESLPVQWERGATWDVNLKKRCQCEENSKRYF